MPIFNELKLAKELMRFPSVTPVDAGTMNFLGLAVMDALGLSAGFAFALLSLGAVREILGNGF